MVSLVFILAGGMATAQADHSWSMFRHDSQRTGFVDNPGHNVLGEFRPAPIWVFPYPEDDRDPIDNSAGPPAFDTTGNWEYIADPDGTRNAYNDDYMITTTSSGSATAKWTFDMSGMRSPSGADYFIWVWMPTYPRRTDPAGNYIDPPVHRRAEYTVRINGNVIGTYKLDQSVGGYSNLGRRTFHLNDTDILEIILTNETEDYVLDENGNKVPVTSSVIADAIMIEQDAGTIYASPVHSQALDPAQTNGLNNILIVPVTKDMPMEAYGAAGSAKIGVVYGIATEADSGIPTRPNGLPLNDDRGFVKWSFPEVDRNWVEKGFKSTPALTRYQGNEVAVCPGSDGLIYAIRTDNGQCVWKGPGIILEDPTDANGWQAGTHPGFQGNGYFHAQAVKDTATATAYWRPNIPKDDSYAIYAWIPPSTSGEQYITDATYTIKFRQGSQEYTVDVTVDQKQMGGRWARLGGYYRLESQANSLEVSLTNKTGMRDANDQVPTDAYVAADALRVVPYHVGGFDHSSPVFADVNSTDFYLASISGRVYKFRIGEELPIWVYPDPENDKDKNEHPGIIYASPTLNPSGDTLYVGSNDGFLYALKTQDTVAKDESRCRWTFPAKQVSNDPGPPSPSMLPQITVTAAYGDYIYIATGGWGGNSADNAGRIIAVKDDGTEAWRYPAAGQPSLGAFVYSSPLLFRGLSVGGTTVDALLIGCTNGRFYAVNASTGEGLVDVGLWSAYPNLTSSIRSSAAGTVCASAQVLDNNNNLIMDNNVPFAYVGGEDWRIHRINLKEGKEDWWWDLLGNAYTSSPALFNQRVYIGDFNGYIWAFSTRQAAGGGGGEGWNSEVGPEPPTGGKDQDKEPQSDKADPEIDVFRPQEYEEMHDHCRQATKDTLDNLLGVDDPHKAARYEKGELPDPSSRSYEHEWGQDIYIVVWNLADPNEAKYGKKLKPDEGTQTEPFIGRYAGTVTIRIKSGDAGRDADWEITENIAEHHISYYLDEQGYPVFYGVHRIELGASTPQNPQTPGSRLTISVRETPKQNTGDKIKFGPSEEKYILEHPYPFTNQNPQYFAIKNPLGLIYKDDTGTIRYIGVSGNPAVRNGVQTTKDDPAAKSNGNTPPYLWTGFTSHGTTSTPYDMWICDRSLLGARRRGPANQEDLVEPNWDRQITRFRIQRDDLKWMGGPSQAVNPIWEWETPPGDARLNQPNTSEDYPDISGRNVSSLMGSNNDPGWDAVSLIPGGRGISLDPDHGGTPNPSTWTVGVNDMTITVGIPKYQPANMPRAFGKEWTGYRGTFYAYVDSNNNGVFDKPADPSPDAAEQAKYTRSSVKAEAYRMADTGAHVPVDRRVIVEEDMIDFGEVPHGFGLVPDANGIPHKFHDTFSMNLLPAPAGFNEWFKPFTARNVGNTNLLNIRAALLPIIGTPRGELISDVVQLPDRYIDTDPFTGLPRTYGYGYWIDGAATGIGVNSRDEVACMVTNLDPLFYDDIPPLLTNGWVFRTFHKPRVGDTEPPTLTVPDLPERMYQPTHQSAIYQFVQNFDPTNAKPMLSIAVPVGQPVGRYWGRFTLYEDMPPAGQSMPDGVYNLRDESVGDPIIKLNLKVSEARLTDAFTPGSIPHLDPISVAGSGTGDITPAVYRDRLTGNLHLVWASSRYGKDIVGETQPSSTDPWYLHMSVLENTRPIGFPGSWKFSSGAPQGLPTWWWPTNPALNGGDGAPFPAPDEVKNNNLNLFPWPPEVRSVRFTSPSVATDEWSSRTWLFFGGQAQQEVAATQIPGSTGKKLASKVFYTEVVNGRLNSSDIFQPTADYTMPKFGIRAGILRTDPNPGPTNPMMWAFWYGGNSDRWQMYYTANPNVDDPTTWANEAELPVPKGLSSVAEPSPVFRWWEGRTGLPWLDTNTGQIMPAGTFDVAYSGYSTYHKNSDIYLSRYLPGTAQVSHKQGGYWPVKLQTLPFRFEPEEVLTRDSSKLTWYSTDVDWVADNPLRDFEIWAHPDFRNGDPPPYQPQKLNVGKYTRDPATGAIAFDFSGNATLKDRYRAMVVNPAQGTVKLLKEYGPDLAITVKYKPRAYRLTVESNSDVSPCVVIDDDPNPRYRQSDPPGNPFYLDPNGTWDPDDPPPTDRMWVFWRRPGGPGKPGTGIHYKAYRYMTTLQHDIKLDQDGRPMIKEIQVIPPSDVPVLPIIAPVEIDWKKRQLYFTAEDAIDPRSPMLKHISVTYVRADTDQDFTEEHWIRFAEEDIGGEGAGGGTTFGALTSVMVNEGQVCAYKDPWDPKVWVFWTSTRAGNTDIYYEAISPKFYGEEY